MANSLFNMLAGNQPSIQAQLQQLMSNPMQFLMQRRLNIPAGIQNDPQGIVQHLLNTGQMTQAQFNSLQNYVNTTMRR